VAGPDVEAELVPELVWSLVDKSLLVADPVGGGTRYRSLETVRAFAGELLDAHDESGTVAARLAAHYDGLFGPARGTGRHWMHAVAAELDNLRSVVWAVAAATAAGAVEAAQQDAQRLACAIARHHDAVQSFRSGIGEVSRMVAALPLSTPARVGLLTALGDLHVRTGDAAAAEARARSAEALRTETGAPEWDEVGVEKLLGEVAIQRGQPDRAVAIAETALRGDLSARGRARICNLLGIALATAGSDERAAAAFASELDAATELDDEVLLAHAHGNSAEIALRLGDRPTAALHQRASLELASALGQTGMVAYSLLATARLAVGGEPTDADWRAAVRLVAKAERLLADTGLALYDTDRKVAEEALLSARTRLGHAGYAAEQAAGQVLSPEAAIASAEEVLARAREPSAASR
jgi:hypothetical protein